MKRNVHSANYDCLTIIQGPINALVCKFFTARLTQFARKRSLICSSVCIFHLLIYTFTFPSFTHLCNLGLYVRSLDERFKEVWSKRKYLCYVLSSI